MMQGLREFFDTKSELKHLPHLKSLPTCTFVDNLGMKMQFDIKDRFPDDLESCMFKAGPRGKEGYLFLLLFVEGQWSCFC